MALIGDMQYLTIGSKTYRIASSSLPIASASTLGGIKVGTGLTIDSTTGVLSATGTSVTIDNALSDSSTNPVQNKVIKEALDDKIEQAVCYVTITGNATNGYEADKTFTEVETAYNAGYAIFALNGTSVFPLTLKASAGMNFTRYAGGTGKQITWTKSSNAITITSFSLAMDDEIPTKVSDLINDSNFTSNEGTVTSVRVQATSPVQSSISTAQSSSLNTTISLADGYGDTKNPYGIKTANYILAGPSSGSAAVPSFRELVASDIPDLSETYLTSYTETDPTVPNWAKASSKPTYTASEVGALPDTTVIPTKTSDLTNDSNFMSGMTILSYGSSTWNDFITAYQANHVVYCRASSNSNPASGSQTRMAFMAYVSDATNPTNVEFQYYRSVSSHTASQQGDQVYVYKLTNANAWTVTVREASVKVTTGSSDGIDVSYSSGAVTIGHTNSVTAQSTQALYPITYDAQGHITGSGTAVTVPTNSNIVDLIYPVGSIYMSVNSTSPATLFGGTWTQIEDTFLLAAGSTYTAGDTGGSATESYTPAGDVVGKAISLANAGIKAASVEATGYGVATTGGGFKNRLVILNTTSATTHNHTFSGTAETLNTMPPYLTVYMWQRTA